MMLFYTVIYYSYTMTYHIALHHTEIILRAISNLALEDVALPPSLGHTVEGAGTEQEVLQGTRPASVFGGSRISTPGEQIGVSWKGFRKE